MRQPSSECDPPPRRSRIRGCEYFGEEGGLGPCGVDESGDGGYVESEQQTGERCVVSDD